MSISMRDAFLDELYNIARKDRQVILISNDFGAPSLDKFRRDCASQFIHIGIAEQNMVNVATGLAMAGKIVYMYSIAPFLPLRCYEQLRVHLAFKQYHITGVMVGAGYSYDLSGPSHQALEDIAVMNALPGFSIFNPSDSAMGAALAQITYVEAGPKYVRFDREKFPDIYHPGDSFSDGLAVLKEGTDLTMIASGIMVHQALKVAGELKKHSVDAGVIDLYRVKPIDEKLLLRSLSKTKRILTIEESFANSGIGTIISTIVTESEEDLKLRIIGIPNCYFGPGKKRAELQQLSGLDVDSIVKTALEFLERVKSKCQSI
jgi:transketolase